MKSNIAVMGATGNVGRQVVRHLGRRGVVPRVLTRKPEATWQTPVERIVGDVQDPKVVGALLAGVQKLFFFAAIALPDEVDQGVLAAAKQSGVDHLVMLSTIGSDGEAEIGRRHRLREEWIERSGIGWTLLRPGFFMSNTLRWAESIRSQGKVFAPALDAEMAPISPKDIAEVAANALTSSGLHVGKAYPLTGGELLTARQQVEIVARVLGRSIACVELSPEAAAQGARQRGMPDWVVSSLEDLWRGLAAGQGGVRTDSFEKVTGHAPQRFEDWCDENRGAFLG